MKKNKKAVIIIISAAVLLVLLFPLRTVMKDGGSAEYAPITKAYSVTRLHRLTGVEGEYIAGTIVKIFGAEIYHNEYLSDGASPAE